MNPYLPADESDPAVAAFVRRARHEAVGNPVSASAELVGAARKCDTGQLNHLAFVVMVRHPDAHAGATGAGAVWAVASRLVNEAAHTALKDRPLFELVA